jgi:hypothetical protein
MSGEELDHYPIYSQIVYEIVIRIVHVYIDGFHRRNYSYDLITSIFVLRILRSSRDITAGDLLFDEIPLVSGPAKTKTGGHDKPACIVCLKQVQNIIFQRQLIAIQFIFH